jgi:hypothetical protein
MDSGSSAVTLLLYHGPADPSFGCSIVDRGLHCAGPIPSFLSTLSMALALNRASRGKRVLIKFFRAPLGGPVMANTQ